MTSQISTNGVNAEVLGSFMGNMKSNPDMATVTFSVKTAWERTGFKVISTGKDFLVGGQQMQRDNGFTLQSDFPKQMGGMGEGPTVCETCMASIATCLTQTMVAYATMMGVQLDRVEVNTEGDADLRGFTGISENVRPGAQEFRIKVHLESNTAAKDQLEKLYEMGRKFSPAMDTITHGTVIKTSLV